MTANHPINFVAHADWDLFTLSRGTYRVHSKVQQERFYIANGCWDNGSILNSTNARYACFFRFPSIASGVWMCMDPPYETKLRLFLEPKSRERRQVVKRDTSCRKCCALFSFVPRTFYFLLSFLSFNHSPIKLVVISVTQYRKLKG